MRSVVFKNVPEYLEWNNDVYKFVQNKSNIVLYKSVNNGSVIVVEDRHTKFEYNRFYVLFQLTAVTTVEPENIDDTDPGVYDMFVSATIKSNLLDSISRTAKPLYKLNKS